MGPSSAVSRTEGQILGDSYAESKELAAEARATGVGMILAPVLDLAREPRWGRVEEDFGEDPYLTGQLGLAYVRGALRVRSELYHLRL